jgi:hypothetical protein
LAEITAFVFMNGAPQLDRSEAIRVGSYPRSPCRQLALKGNGLRAGSPIGAQRSEHALGSVTMFESDHAATLRKIRLERPGRNGSRPVKGEKPAVHHLPPAPTNYFAEYDLINTPVLEPG